MRGLLVNQWSNIGEDVYYKLRLNSPPGGWFPALQELNWCITKSNHPYTSMFFSPHLKKVHLAIPWSPIQPEVLNGILPGFASTITVLPTSALQYLSIDTDDCGMRWECLQVSFSSVILRCGPSLTELTSPIPLSDAAKNHVIRLPHLHTWHVQGPPPNYSVSTLPSDFPPLVDFIIGEGGGPGWISLFKQLEGRTSSTQTPWSRVKESLKYLKVKRCSGLIIDIPFVSLIQRFRNLVGLEIEIHCYDGDGEGQCAFNLNDDNITKFAMALPQLESLVLGHPCSDNTCATTVASLLAVSVHCVKLEQLEIHFNTTNIVGDLEDILVAPRFQQLRSLPRCKLSSLDVSGIPLDLDESDFDTVVSGMIGIFPFLESCDGFERIWEEMFEEFWGDDDSPSASPVSGSLDFPFA